MDPNKITEVLAEQATIETNLKLFRSWLSKHSIARAIKGFLSNFIDGDSTKYNLIIDDSMQPRTNGKEIWVSLISSVLTQNDATPDDWMLYLTAATAHEAQHCNSSSFSDIEGIMDWYGKYLETNYGLHKKIGASIAKQYLNIVEDGRIEAIATRRRPGTQVPFIALNALIRAGTEINAPIGLDPQKEFQDFSNQVLSYAKTGLYAPGIKLYSNTEFEKQYMAIEPLIDKGVTARTSADCRKAVEEMLEKLADYFAPLIQRSEQLQQMGDGDEDNEYTSDDESEYNDGSSGDSSGNSPRSKSPTKTSSNQNSDSEDSDSDAGGGAEDDGEEDRASEGSQSKDGKDGKDGKSETSGKDKTKGKKSDQSSKNGKRDDNSDPEDFDPLNPNESRESAVGTPGKRRFADAIDEKPLSEEQIEEARRRMSAQVKAADAAESEQNSPPPSDGLNEKSIADIRASYHSQTDSFTEKTIAIPGSDPLPPECKTEAMMLRREIEKILSARRQSQRNLRRGTLDAGALWKTGFHDGTIFSRKGNPSAGSCAFYLLLDNSGSTQEDGGNKVAKYIHERRAAAVIEEAAKGLLPVKIATFNADCGAEHTIIRRFDDQASKNYSWNSLKVFGPSGCNEDSIHIRVAAEELRRRRENRKILFILSDGEPSAYASRSEAVTEVHDAVADARRKGVIVIPIMFGNQSFLDHHVAKYRQMYEKNIISSPPSEISMKLALLFRNIVKL